MATTTDYGIPDPTSLPTSQLIITRFSNLYSNDLGFSQGGKLVEYNRASEGAILRTGSNGFWFSRIADDGSFFNIRRRFLYIVFEVRGFLDKRGSFSIFLADGETNKEEYFNLKTWVPMQKGGLEIGEVFIGDLRVVNPASISLIGFLNLSPANTSFQFLSVYLSSYSVISGSRSSSPQFSSTSDSSFTGNEDGYTWIIWIASIGGGMAVIGGLIAITMYSKRKRNRILLFNRGTVIIKSH
jgi:hypothetical protein